MSDPNTGDEGAPMAEAPQADAESEATEEARPARHRWSRRRIVIAAVVGVVVVAVVVACVVLVRDHRRAEAAALRSPQALSVIGAAPDVGTSFRWQDSVALDTNMELDSGVSNAVFGVNVEDPAAPGYGIAMLSYLWASVGSSYWYSWDAQQYAEGLSDGTECRNTPAPVDRTSYEEWSDVASRDYYCYRHSPGMINMSLNQPGTAYRDGIVDALAQTPGAHEPKTPGAMKLRGFHLSDGSAAWTYDLGALGLADPGLKPIAAPAPSASGEEPNRYVAANGQGHIATIVEAGAAPDATPPDHPAQVLLVLDAATGSVLSTTTLPDGDDQIAGYVGSSVLVWQRVGSGVTLLSIGEGGQTQWQHASSVDHCGGQGSSAVIAGRWVCAGDAYVSAADGTPAPFGADLSATVAYAQSQVGVFRVDASDAGAQVTRWDAATGKAVWAAPVQLSGTGFVATKGGLYSVSGGALDAYSLDDGHRLWTSPDDTFQSVGGATQGAVVVATTKGYAVVSATGHVVDSSDTAPLTDVYVGANTLYCLTSKADPVTGTIAGQLSAYELSGGQIGTRRFQVPSSKVLLIDGTFLKVSGLQPTTLNPTFGTPPLLYDSHISLIV